MSSGFGRRSKQLVGIVLTVSRRSVTRLAGSRIRCTGFVLTMPCSTGNWKSNCLRRFAQTTFLRWTLRASYTCFAPGTFRGADVGDKRLISDGFKSAARRFSIDDVTKVLNFVAAIDHWCAPHARWVSTVAASLECGVQVAGCGLALVLRILGRDRNEDPMSCSTVSGTKRRSVQLQGAPTMIAALGWVELSRGWRLNAMWDAGFSRTPAVLRRGPLQ